ncbi:replication restart helicase PriA [Duncaniella muricolitica]|jgi:primosomal protein N' (replication factor Y)|uniref:replication restart helicase PriA n=2 Tax=Duncaniella TaxID=2518495 RepID=UPI00244E1EC8|nr:primosomal protein N' [Duncaniella muricolitica]
MIYAEVLLPVPIAGAFTYRVPADMEGSIAVGHRVIVPFGRRKSYTGIVTALTPFEPKGYEVKEISMRIDDRPIVRHPQLKHWAWIADYYLCTPGEVYRAAVPAGLKIESETFISPVAGFEEDENDRLSTRELTLLEGLLETGEKRVRLDVLSKKTGISAVGPVVNSLLARNAVMISENLVERYHARKEIYVRLTAVRGDSDELHAAFDAVKKGGKQETALLTLIELSGFMRQGLEEPVEVTRSALMERAGVTSSVIAAMAKKGIVEVYTRKVSRFSYTGRPVRELPELSEYQQTALGEIHRSWLEKDVTLLHGVTSSGKTELYIHLIDYAMKQGRQALYLVPEIALTTQLTTRLQRVFGDKVLIYHSKFSDNERVEIWNRLLDDSAPKVIIGARSSVFLPFASLGLVIVDEEHESAYKQQDPAPRYNARDAAIVLARMHGAKTLLGSATPGVETYRKACTGRYGLVELTRRYEGGELPEMKIVDMTEARKRGQVKGIFSDELRADVGEALSRGMQSILFLNRRGYAPVARCKQCGYVPKCDHCDVSLTYHRRIDKLLCHYCGTPYQVPEVCPACKEPGIEVLGYGTERIEEEVDACFPDAVIARMDLDTTRNKDGYEGIIEDFSAGKSQILVGTQMVTKGLDFGKVSVVGVVNADAVLNFPDFRAAERAFNMIEQVAGRAGRRSGDGKVAIQTYSPSHPLFPFLVAHDYKGFYEYELAERQRYNYPPFVRVIYIYVKHKDPVAVGTVASELAARLRELLGTRVSGPEEPTVGRVQTWYIRRIMLKIEINASISKVKTLLNEVRIDMTNRGRLSGASVYCDVDPM